MTKKTDFIQLNKTITLVTTSPIGWFYSEGKSIKHLHNICHNVLAIVIPGSDCHLQIKLTGSQFKKEATLLRLYSEACKKYGVVNIFAN